MRRIATYSARRARVHGERRASSTDWAAVVILAAIMVLGGTSRIDAWTQLLVQLAAIGYLAHQWVWRGRVKGKADAVAWLPVAAVVAICCLQLVPLPVAVWQALPGHGPMAQIAKAASIDAWQPISIYPAGTVAALVGMVVPLAAIAMATPPDERQARILMIALLIAMSASALLGLVQMGSGRFLLHDNSSPESPVGFFANRNHQAVFLALSLPIAALMGLEQRERRRADHWPLGLWLAFAAVTALLVMLTGSRIGLFVLTAGFAGSLALIAGFTPRGDRVGDVLASSKVLLGLAVGSALFVALILGTAVAGDRLVAIARIQETEIETEGRLVLLPSIWQTAMAFMPFGAGFGAFDRAYRQNEPYDLLSQAYLNRAHSDPLELIVEAGLFGIILMALTGVLLASRVTRIWSLKRLPFSFSVARARIGSIMVLQLAIASLTDYPVRTPAICFVFVLALVWTGSLHRRVEGLDTSRARN